MLINYSDLEAATLNNLIENFILREGTDYGDNEISLAEKNQEILKQIKCGDVVILYSELSESITLLHKNQLAEQQVQST